MQAPSYRPGTGERTLRTVPEVSWGPDDGWRLWIGEGVIEGLVDLLDQHLAIPRVIHGPAPKDGVLRGGDAFHNPRAAAFGVVPWLNHPDVTERLQRMLCCVVVDKEAAVTEALRRLHEEGTPFPSEAIPGFDEDMAPVAASGKPMVVDPGSPLGPERAAVQPPARVTIWDDGLYGRRRDSAGGEAAGRGSARMQGGQ